MGKKINFGRALLGKKMDRLVEYTSLDLLLLIDQIKFQSRGRKSGPHFEGREKIRGPMNFIHLWHEQLAVQLVRVRAIDWQRR